MPGYGQFCPVAKAMEVLDERWTLLVLRELMAGSTRYNEIRRGVPRMSPALLSKRLRSLERAGLVTHVAGSYTLTPCGADLFEVVQGIGVWGLRWVPELGDADHDPHLLMWDMRRTVVAERWPPGPDRRPPAPSRRRSARPDLVVRRDRRLGGRLRRRPGA